jgi:hypothetical protein
MRRIRFCVKFSILLLTAVLINGCSSTGSYISTEYATKPYVGTTTERAMAYEGVKRNPLIIVHGFLGASLIDIKTKENVWGTFSAAGTISVSADQVKDITHPMAHNKALKDLKDDVIAERLLETAKISVLGTTFEVNAYKNMIDILIKGGYVPANKPLPEDKKYASMFLFGYDWRRDLPENAARLQKFIKEKKAYMQKQYEEQYGIKDYNVQFDVIAHSMGGLVSRYFLRYGDQDLPKDGSMPKLDWGGSKFIDRLIIVGTPNAGYLDTYLEMIRGGGVHPYPPAALGTLPTYYQMLPAPGTKSFAYSDDPDGEEIDIFDSRIWEKYKWSLADPKQDKTLKILLPDIKSKKKRYEIALDHLNKCLTRAKQFIKAMQIKASPPDDVKLYLVFGYGVKTTKRALINRKTGKIDKITYTSGDGKVGSQSALWDERMRNPKLHFMHSPIDWSHIVVLRGAHMAITEIPGFEDNILFILTMEETKKQVKDLKTIRQEESVK